MTPEKYKETVITPQWVTVKEELLADFFDLADTFSNWQSSNITALKHNWINKLRGLYLKVRLKVSQKEGYAELSKNMDFFINNPLTVTINQLIEYTLKLLEFIESTGITSVESESSDPVEDFMKTGFPG